MAIAAVISRLASAPTTPRLLTLTFADDAAQSANDLISRRASLANVVGDWTRDPATNKPNLALAIPSFLTKYIGGPEILDRVLPDNPDFARNQIYEQRAQMLMRRGNAQAAIDKSQAAQGRAALQAGSPQQERGFTPAVTKAPIRPEPSAPLTPEQVAGPDTSGKGNLLTPLAKTGDPRAAAELLRRGRRVLFVPDSDTPSYISSDDFADLLNRLQQ